MRSTHPLVVLLLGCLVLPSYARPGYIPGYNSGPVNPYYSTVGGSSVVNVFPSGYAYQTLLDDGSSTYVIYVNGPQGQEQLQQLLRSPSLPLGGAVGPGPATPAESGPQVIPNSISVSTPPPNTVPAATNVRANIIASTPTPIITRTNQATDSPIASTEATEVISPPSAPTEAIPAAQNPFFNFPVFPSFPSFVSTVPTYIANPFNSFMNYFGLPLPQQQISANKTVGESATSDAQASNISPVSAVLAPRIISDSSTIATADTAATSVLPSATTTTSESSRTVTVTTSTPEAELTTPENADNLSPTSETDSTNASAETESASSAALTDATAAVTDAPDSAVNTVSPTDAAATELTATDATDAAVPATETLESASNLPAETSTDEISTQTP